MKNRAAMLMGLIGLAALTGSFGQHNGPSNRGQSEAGGIPDKPKRIIPKGSQLFTIRGIEVVALSYDRAYDKVKKKHPELF